jgi:hypothetical protein
MLDEQPHHHLKGLLSRLQLALELLDGEPPLVETRVLVTRARAATRELETLLRSEFTRSTSGELMTAPS